MLEAAQFTEPRVRQQGHILSLIWYDTAQYRTLLHLLVPQPFYQTPGKDARQPRTEPRPRAATTAQMTSCKAESTGPYPPHSCLSYVFLLPPHLPTPSARLASQTLLQPKHSSNLPLSSPSPPPHFPSSLRLIPLARVVQCS